MPELPEVEVVRAGLARHITGATIDAVEVLHPRPVRRHLAGPQAFADELQGLRFAAPRRRGKYLWLPLDSGDAILAHLGMSGQMVLQPATAPDERHLRVRFQISGGEPGRELRFVDQRMFGGLHLSLDGAELPAEIAHIALDPLEPDFEAGAVVRKMRKRRSAIKRQLLDQSLISGVGNIYADEALWRAKLHGERQGDRIPAKQLHALLVHVREVMSEALAQGGTSFDTLYVNVNGESGYFSRSLDAYGREGEPCHRCASPMRRATFMNRSSYFCARCQRRPRPQAAPD